jgi:hypothetical protein
MGETRSLAQDQQILVSLGAMVISSEKRTIPVRISNICGAPTGAANTYIISEADWNKIRRSFVGPAGFAIWIYDAKTITVYKYDGTLLCEVGKEIPLEVMARQLTDAGISIVSQRKSDDGLMHIQLCGASTGRVNAYEIASSDTQKALDLGFSYLVTPETAKMILGEGGPSLTSRVKAEGGWPLPWPFPW